MQQPTYHEKYGDFATWLILGLKSPSGSEKGMSDREINELLRGMAITETTVTIVGHAIILSPPNLGIPAPRCKLPFSDIITRTINSFQEDGWYLQTDIIIRWRDGTVTARTIQDVRDTLS